MSKRKLEIQEASKYYVEERSFFDDEWEESLSRTGFVAGAEWADENRESPWIAVEDKLPEIGQAVFIKTSQGTYGVSWIDHDLDWQGGVAYSPFIGCQYQNELHAYN